jgi:hypothetical protein
MARYLSAAGRLGEPRAADPVIAAARVPQKVETMKPKHVTWAWMVAVAIGGAAFLLGPRIVPSSRSPRGEPGARPSGSVALAAEPRASTVSDVGTGDRSRVGAYPPIMDVPTASASSVGTQVCDEDFVLGVEIAGQSRAYPLSMLNKPERHVLNESLGGQSIAVTWCGLSQAPAVFSRRVEDKELVFFVTGELFGENMLMQDSETGSQWPQLLGRAVAGPLKDEMLDRIPSTWTDWKTWRTEHPDTTILELPRTTEGMRHESSYSDSNRERRYFSTFQWGLAREGKSLSWPFMELARERVVNDALAGQALVIVFDSWSSTATAFDRRLGDRVLTFHWATDGLRDDATGSQWNSITGRATQGALLGRRLTPVSGVVSQIRAWRILHPESHVRSHAG